MWVAGRVRVSPGLIPARHRAGDITVSNTRLIGGATKGTITCVAVSYGSAWYENTCP
jgi:hypothetical protein